MRFYRYKREETLSYHSFGEVLIYVCYLSDTRGNRCPGVSLLNSDAIIEVPYPLTPSTANSFAEFLERAANGDVPSRFKLAGRGTAPTSIRFSKFDQRGIRNSFFHGIFIFGRLVWGTARPASLKACASSLRKLVW